MAVNVMRRIRTPGGRMKKHNMRIALNSMIIIDFIPLCGGGGRTAMEKNIVICRLTVVTL